MRSKLGRRYIRCLLLVTLAISAAGCRPTSLGTPTPLATPIPSVTPAQPDNGSQPAPGGSGAMSLRIWLPPDIASASVRDQGRTLPLIDLIAQHAQMDSDITLNVTIKALQGPGGLRESLLATAPVAPQRLPHLALIDTADLPALVAAGLAQPLADTGDSLLNEDLSPLALEAVTVGDSRYGLPLATNLLFMVHDTEAIGAPPKNWAELVTGGNPLLFPAQQNAADSAAADVLLTLYLSEGGVVATEPPALDTAALARALAAFQVGKAAGVLSDEATAIDSFEASWAGYLAGQAKLAAVTSLQLLRADDGDSATISRTALAPLPNSRSRPLVLGRVLAWVVLTPEPGTQQAAWALAKAALATDLQRQLTARTYYLPVTPAAWDEPTLAPWREPLAELYALARPVPAHTAYATIEAALGEAAASVASGAANPTGAASLAAARLAQAE